MILRHASLEHSSDKTSLYIQLRSNADKDWQDYWKDTIMFENEIDKFYFIEFAQFSLPCFKMELVKLILEDGR